MFTILDTRGNAVETATTVFEGYRVIDALDKADPSNGPHVFSAPVAVVPVSKPSLFSFFRKAV